MKNSLQKAFGIANTQIAEIYNARPAIEFLPVEVEEVLDSIIMHDDPIDDNGSIVIPDLPAKNAVNTIDTSYFRLIKEDFVHFNAIENAIKCDSTGTLVKKYNSAKRILQQQYLGEFSPNFPSFVSAVINHICKNNNTAKILRVTTFLHYMYSECDIGRRLDV